MVQTKKYILCLIIAQKLHYIITLALHGTWPAHKNMVASIWTLLHICCLSIKICMKTDIFAALSGSTGIWDCWVSALYFEEMDRCL